MHGTGIFTYMCLIFKVHVSKLAYMGGMRSEKSSAKTSSTPKTALRQYHLIPFSKQKTTCVLFFLVGFLLFGKKVPTFDPLKLSSFFIRPFGSAPIDGWNHQDLRMVPS